jgi:hypothetical protein
MNTGVALFNPSGLLIHADVIGNTYKDAHQYFYYTVTRGFNCRGVRAVFELPQIYRSSKAKSDPNLLIPLAVQGGHWDALLYSVNGSVTKVKPNAWKGQVPKNISHSRTTQKLSTEETAIALKNSYPLYIEHNKWDAIGLGIWYLERMDIRDGGH